MTNFVQSCYCRWQTDSFTFVRVVSSIFSVFAIYQVIYNDICKNGNTLIRSQGRTFLGYNKRYRKLVKENSLVTSPLTGTTLLESGLNTG